MKLAQGLVLCLIGVGAARAEPTAARSTSAIVVPVLAVDGRPAFCTRNLSLEAAPQREGGYRVAVAPGRYAVRLTMADHRVEVMATVSDDGDVVVPPVFVRGHCHQIEVQARRTSRAVAGGGWALRFDRIFRAAYGVSPDVASLEPPPQVGRDRASIELARWQAR